MAKRSGVDPAEFRASLKGLVFLTILLTVGIQGFTAPVLAQRLGLVQEGAELSAEAGAAAAAVPGAEP